MIAMIAMLRGRYCEMCDRWWPRRHRECPACGMLLRSAEK